MFDSLDSLKVASYSLLPPFKSVQVQNEPLMEKFPETPAEKLYSSSQTIIVTKERYVKERTSEYGIREMISNREADFQPLDSKRNLDQHLPSKEGPEAEADVKLQTSKLAATHFSFDSERRAKQFLSFEISELMPREMLDNRLYSRRGFSDCAQVKIDDVEIDQVSPFQNLASDFQTPDDEI